MPDEEFELGNAKFQEEVSEAKTAKKKATENEITSSIVIKPEAARVARVAVF
jgi:RPA family protein